MFKYVWILILVVLYLLWGYSAVKDIIDTFKNYTFDNILGLFDELDPSSSGFLLLTVLILACSSFMYWIICVAGG